MIEGIDCLPMEALERIDRICCRFEQAWKKDERPRIADYLVDVDGRERVALLRELLALDIDYCRKVGRPVLSENYAESLPDDRTLVESSIQRSTMSSLTHIGAAQGDVTLVHQGHDHQPARIPERIGRYRILEKLGAGGFGVVYRGFDEQLHRHVAIKVPHRDIIAPENKAQRFLREARLVAQLDHGGIVPVYDCGQTDEGEYFVVSRYMEGGDLAARIKWARLVYAESANIILQVADALHYAHTRGLVHRDIKPSNLLSDTGGAVYVADFGEALRVDVSTSLTFVGTPAYMSPEQARGEGHRVDARTDSYALGVVFYELLTGQRPFRDPNVTTLLEDVIHREPTPPRELDPEIPAELERICLKAMSKRVADRYDTALKLRDDLRSWLDGAGEADDDATRNVSHPSFVIPKGLRSFDTADADFFLRLLPGPRDRNGLPEAVRFWRSKIESTDPDDAFRVGVMYGPSGCGKSSLLKAGLLPCLGENVRPVFVEARADSTERDLVAALRKALDRGGDLMDLARNARGEDGPAGRKVLIVIDQFEQWLHVNHQPASAPLTSALRQCDGVRLQCLVLVRDDFWMPVTRFMRALELPLVDHRNALAVDLFDAAHARKVLIQFGQAYERLPGHTARITRSQSRFLDESVAAISRNGAVVPIRLSVLADMMKTESWEPATLRRLGGAEGLGVTFLDRCFSRSDAPVPHRAHAQAARQVLKALLPEPSVDIRGHLRSGMELMRASGYEDSPEAFAELLQLLDQKLRLVTPVTHEAEPAIGRAELPLGERYYQLTHDFMVSPIREWITQEQRQTARGRAELCLSERASLWTAKPENRQLPGLLEWGRIRLFTRRASWSEPQRAMMTRAGRRLAWQSTCAVLLAFFAVLLGVETMGRIRAKSAVGTVRSAAIDDVLNVIRDLQPQRRWLDSPLRAELAEEGVDPRDRLKLRLALLRDDSGQLEHLTPHLFEGDPRILVVVRDAVVEYAPRDARRDLCRRLWGTLDDASAASESRFRAACALAGLDSASPLWDTRSDTVAQWLLARRIERLSDWLEALRPVSARLLPPLERAFLTAEEGEDQTSALALAAFLEHGDDTTKIVELIEVATPVQLSPLVSALESHGARGIEQLRSARRTARAAPSDVSEDDASAPLPESISRQLAEADGVATTRWAFCQTLSWDRFPELARRMRDHGYRPARIRPFLHEERLRAAVVWMRDRFEGTWEIGLSLDEFHLRDAELRRQGMRPIDVAAYRRDDRWLAAGAWVADGVEDDSRVTLASRYGNWTREADRLEEEHYDSRSTQIFGHESSDRGRSSIWRRHESRRDTWTRYRLNRVAVEERHNFSNVVLDATVWPTAEADGANYETITKLDPDIESRTLVFDSPGELVERSSELRRERFEPVSLSVVSGKGDPTPLTLSVWHRSSDVYKPVAVSAANVAMALMVLGDADAALPHLANSPIPDVRSYLIQRMGAARVPVEIVDRYLRDETLDADRRQAFLLCLGGYNRRWFSQEQQRSLTDTIRELYGTDTDAGVHAAAGWLLKRWAVETDRPAGSLAGGATHRSWFRDVVGQDMVVLDYRDPDEGRYSTQPPSGHRFAIAATPTTLGQFRRFRPSQRFDPNLENPAECPVTVVNWYDAAAYCNWLSELEGLPPSQWCYLPNKDGEYAEGMKIAPDHIRRRGYRLPLATEFVCAACAGTDTPFHFGRDLHLIDRYAWTRNNARSVANPVGSLLPNMYGLFDVLGNIKEWCQDGEAPLEEGSDITDSSRRQVAGGYHGVQLRALVYYCMHENPVDAKAEINGFRVAKTIRSGD